MRELKFRAWDKKDNCMHVCLDMRDLPFWDWASLSHVPVMQYTGLKDKNGIEIYEGDILGLDSREPFGYVTFDKAGFRLETSRDKSNFLHNYNRFNLQIIGNIYENPELLKK